MDKSFPAVQTRVLQTGKAKWKEKGVEVSFPADWDCNKNSIVQNINKLLVIAAGDRDNEIFFLNDFLE